jgi:hypothetical protein
MKSELKEAENTVIKEREYPYIGKYTEITNSDNYVCVLFTSPKKGIVIYCGVDSSYSLGYWSADWCEEPFKVLQSTAQIVLQND